MSYPIVISQNLAIVCQYSAAAQGTLSPDKRICSASLLLCGSCGVISSDLCNGFAFVQHLVALSEFGDDLFWCMSFALHVISSRIYYGRSSHIRGGSSEVDHSRAKRSYCLETLRRPAGANVEVVRVRFGGLRDKQW